VKSVVVKLGTQLLSDREGKLDADFLSQIAQQVAALRSRGIHVTIVSSGAIGAGLRELNLPKRPTDLGKLQAVAAVGQRKLMDAWADAFEPHRMPVAQLLLTREDIENRVRFLNTRNTIFSAQEMGAVPIINENDTISTDELIKITFGDNDILAALVAHALRANLLVLLSVVDGILDSEGKSVRLIDNIDSATALVRSEKSSLGKGGMNSKVQAAKTLTDAGEAMVVADGRMANVLERILNGEEVGTLFVPAGKKLSSRSRWIGSVRPSGSILVDAGCAKALREHNRSLLAAGVTGVDGRFERGDVVGIVSPEGALIAKGLSNYSSSDVGKIKGMKTTQVRTLLAEAAYDEVVHRDNLVHQ
jgi:glutamate 5-kinase